MLGSYVHGLLASAPLRNALLQRLGVQSAMADYAQTVEDALDEVAALLEQHADIDAMVALAMG